MQWNVNRRFSNVRLSNSVWFKQRWNFWLFRNGRRPDICWRDCGTTNTWYEGNCYDAGFRNLRSHSGLHVSLLWTALGIWKWLSKKWTPYVARRLSYSAGYSTGHLKYNWPIGSVVKGACLFIFLTHTRTHNVAVSLNTV